VQGRTTTKALTDQGRPLGLALAGLGCALSIAACGSTNSSTESASNPSTQLLTFSECMRSHGVPSFPDPNGQGIHIGPGSGIDPASPAFRTARSACSKLLPGGGPGNQHPTAQQIEMARQLSECMRRHGVTGFPDPSFTPPSGPTGNSLVVDLGGVVLAVPSTINPSSSVFVQAANACHFPLPGA
jgi:hypothetical protein